MVDFSGILFATVELPSGVAIPEGYKQVTSLHITLLSSELPKAVRKELKGIWGMSSLPEFPSITFESKPFFANNGKKESLVLNCNEQDEIRAWLVEVIAILGLSVTVNPERVFHLSVANRTGSKFDSVPDPWNHRVES